MICMFKVMHYCWQMPLKILEINVLKYMNLILLIFICPWTSTVSLFKQARVKLESLTDIDILLMVEKGIKGGTCNAIHRYARANNKYMKKKI